MQVAVGCDRRHTLHRPLRLDLHIYGRLTRRRPSRRRRKSEEFAPGTDCRFGCYLRRPSYLSAADAGLSFIKSCFSKIASSPTKNAEYLACGLRTLGGLQ